MEKVTRADFPLSPPVTGWEIKKHLVSKKFGTNKILMYSCRKEWIYGTPGRKSVLKILKVSVHSSCDWKS